VQHGEAGVVGQPEFLGAYHVKRRLGQGAFASVWLAQDERLRAPVAVKVLADNWAQDPVVKGRFLQEASLMRRIDDDRVVRVYAVGELEDGRPFFAMEWADGGTLEARLPARRGPSSTDEAVGLVIEILAGLAVVHATGVVHRDLKPSNVLFKSVPENRRFGGPSEKLLLGDLGLAKDLTAGSGFTASAGTPRYRAPEQTSLGIIDGRADLYAVAVMLAELLIGEVRSSTSAPHESDLSELRRAAAVARVPDTVVEAIERGLARDPADRYPSAEEMARALTAAVPGSASTRSRERPFPRAAQLSSHQAMPADPPQAAAPPPPALARPARTLRRRSLPIVLPASVLAVGGAVSGFLLAPASGVRPRSQTATAGHVAISYAAPWRRATAIPAAAAPLELSDPLALVERSLRRRTALVLGTSQAVRPTLLPSALPSDYRFPAATVVRLGGRDFGRFVGVRYTGAASPETIYALPTSRGTVLAVCLTVPADAPGVLGECEHVLASLRPPGTPLALTPDASFASALTAITSRLTRAQTAGAAKLAHAETPARQGTAARELAQALGEAARAVADLSPGPIASEATMAIAASMGRLATAYGRLAQSYAHDDVPRYRAASAAVRQALAALRGGFAQLAQVGYAITRHADLAARNTSR
jgi:serine/threonine protein kinase